MVFVEQEGLFTEHMANGGDFMLFTVPACRSDESFLFQVYASTRKDEVSSWGWDQGQQDAFLKMQFMARQQSYALQYPNADHRIVVYNGQKIGQMITIRNEKEILLVDIALLAEFRSGGIGRSLLKLLQDEAGQSDKPILLQVMKSNPARYLYERLGFFITGESGTHYTMKWYSLCASKKSFYSYQAAVFNRFK